MQYNCETCGKVFATNQNFKKHLRTHTGEKPFTCDVCGKSISDPSYLLAHKRKHLTDENGDALYMYNCHLCEKGFNRKGYLRTHLYNHKFPTLPRQEKKKEKVQYEENYDYDESRLLEYDHRFRLSDKNGDRIRGFFCVFCGKSFSRIGYLRKHLQVHKEGKIKTGKPLRTEHLQETKGEDGETIGNKGDVEEKGKVKEGPWKITKSEFGDKEGREFYGFPCSLCPKHFSRIPNLKAHLQAHDEGSFGRKNKVSKKKKRKSRSKKVVTLHDAFPKHESKNKLNGSKETIGIIDMKIDIEDESKKVTKNGAKSLKNTEREMKKEDLNNKIWAKMDKEIQIQREKENTIKYENKIYEEIMVGQQVGEFADNVENANFHLDRKTGRPEERIMLLLPEKTKLVKIESKDENVKAIPMHQEKAKSLSNSAIQDSEKKRKTTGRSCSFCGRIFSQIGNLNRHEAIKHRGVRLECSQCPLLFKDKKTLLKHGWNHNDPKLQCTDCGIRFKHPDTLTNHFRVTHDNLESMLNCNICRKDFRNKDTLRLHRMNLHEKENKAQESYTCEQCGKTTRSIKHLQDHTKIHNQSFSCKTCGKIYKSVRSLRDHTLSQHPRPEDDTGKEYSCDQCGKNKATDNLLKVHMKLHKRFILDK